MSVNNDMISPVDVGTNMTLKDTLEPTTTNGEANVVDGAYTTNGKLTNATEEPVVIIAEPLPAENATLLPKETTPIQDNNTTLPQNNTNNTSANEQIITPTESTTTITPSTPAVSTENVPAGDISSSTTTKEVLFVEPATTQNAEKKREEDGVVNPSDVVLNDITIVEKPAVAFEEDKKTRDALNESSSGITPRKKGNNSNNNMPTTTSTPSTPKTPKMKILSTSSDAEASNFTHNRTISNNSNNSNSSTNVSYNNNNNSLSNSANNIPGMQNMPELKSSARNLRNSVLGIEMEEEVDENGVKVRKIKRKERTHSRIVLRHKKNLIGETIYKGHQSWVLMLNIQTGIRNAVGRGHSRSTVSKPLNNIINNLNNNSNNTSNNSSNNNSNIINNNNNNSNNNNVINNSNGSVASTPKSPIEFLGPNNFDNISEFYASPKVLFFPPEGSANTIPHTTGAFKFKDYCPFAFRFLRHRFGIDTADYMVSLCNTQKNGENALRELPTPGKSGSLFFFSHDMRFIIKTIPKSEAKLLRSLLPSYVDHIANDENTLLPKFFGLHRVKPQRGRQVRFLVMNNIFQTRKTIHERYDLKGSTLGRRASEEEKKKDTVTYKDLDFVERHMKIQIGPEKRVALLEQLNRDCKFLAKLNIMDYSLLIGVHNSEKEDEYLSAPPSPQQTPKHMNPLDHEYFHSIFQENDGGMKGLDENGVPTGTIYYMGIIDILMLYSLRKKIEHTYKSLRYGKDEEISSVSPPEYATRFYQFTSTAIT